MPIAPPEPVDTRHILQPVERGENPDSPENLPEGQREPADPEDGQKDGDKSGDGEDKESKKKEGSEQVSPVAVLSKLSVYFAVRKKLNMSHLKLLKIGSALRKPYFGQLWTKFVRVFPKVRDQCSPKWQNNHIVRF
jgi:hypothetical protein